MTMRNIPSCVVNIISNSQFVIIVYTEVQLRLARACAFRQVVA